MKTSKHYGIAELETGEYSVSKPRVTEAAALVLAMKIPGVRHFTMEANSAAEARKKAANKLVHDALIEPTASELAESVDFVPPVRDIGTRRWFALVFSGTNDAVNVGADIGYRTALEALEADGSEFAVQAKDPYDARERLDANLEAVPPTILPLPHTAARIYGTKAVDATEYFVMPTGTVHVSGDCRFVRKFVAAGELKSVAYEGNLVSELQEAHEKAGVAFFKNRKVGSVDVAEGIFALDYCRFCSVSKATAEVGA